MSYIFIRIYERKYNFPIFHYMSGNILQSCNLLFMYIDMYVTVNIDCWLRQTSSNVELNENSENLWMQAKMFESENENRSSESVSLLRNKRVFPSLTYYSTNSMLRIVSAKCAFCCRSIESIKSKTLFNEYYVERGRMVDCDFFGIFILYSLFA